MEVFTRVQVLIYLQLYTRRHREGVLSLVYWALELSSEPSLWLWLTFKGAQVWSSCAKLTKSMKQLM